MRKMMITASAFLFGMALSTAAFAQGGYGAPGQTEQPGTVHPPTQQEPVQVLPERELGMQQPGDGQIISSGQIVGQNVLTPDGERLGQIKGLKMDMEAGQIGYAVVSAGGVLGIGRREYLVPWNALQMDPQQGTYVLDVTPQQLRDAPTFREITTREEAVQLHEYYGVAPYWEGDRLEMRRDQEPYPWERPGGEVQERDPRLPNNPS
jgi:sporulation protein YlmC with PRC-barrel domain